MIILSVTELGSNEGTYITRELILYISAVVQPRLSDSASTDNLIYRMQWLVRVLQFSPLLGPSLSNIMRASLSIPG
jgi:hypothetical protein